jgi:hypothetical protein
MKEYFSARKFHIKPLPVSLPSKDIAESAVELGSFYTADERLIAIYEVKVTDIAETRSLTVATIESHLSHFVSNGDINIEELVSREKLLLIEPAIRNYEGGAITQI